MRSFLRSTARFATVCSWLAAAAAGQLDPGALVPVYQQALAEREKQFGADHPKVARSASDLGLYLRNIGQRDAAIPYLKRAFEIDAKTLGSRHKQVAEDLENLASVAPPEAALPLHLKAAASSDAAISSRNWGKAGDLFAAKGETSSAVAAYRNALAREETASGAQHARVAVRLNDLAQVSDPKAAEPLLRRALAIEAEALGAKNPATAITMNNLANTLLRLGKLEDAEPVARRSLEALEEALGADHPRVAIIHGNLAAILREKQDLQGARRHYARTLAINEALYGPNHKEVAADLENLAEVVEAMGDKQEASRLRERVRRMK